MALHSFNKTVTAAGTPERLLPLADTPSVRCAFITFQPLKTNTDDVYIGGTASNGAPDVTSTKGLVISANSGWVIWPVSATNPIALKDIWLDAAVSGEGIQGVYFTT
jgi:hypothetical protein